MSGLLRVVCDFVWETRTLAQMCALVDCYCNSFSRSKFTKYPVLRWFSKEIGFGTLHLVHLNHGLIARWIESKTRFTPWYLKFSSSPYQTNVLRRKKDQNNLKTVFRFFKELTFICCGLLLFFFSYPRHVWGKMRTECKFLFYFWTFFKKKNVDQANHDFHLGWLFVSNKE